jgi:hypothetical protein
MIEDQRTGKNSGPALAVLDLVSQVSRYRPNESIFGGEKPRGGRDFGMRG